MTIEKWEFYKVSLNSKYCQIISSHFPFPLLKKSQACKTPTNRGRKLNVHKQRELKNRKLRQDQVLPALKSNLQVQTCSRYSQNQSPDYQSQHLIVGISLGHWFVLGLISSEGITARPSSPSTESRLQVQTCSRESQNRIPDFQPQLLIFDNSLGRWFILGLIYSPTRTSKGLILVGFPEVLAWLVLDLAQYLGLVDLWPY